MSTLHSDAMAVATAMQRINAALGPLYANIERTSKRYQDALKAIEKLTEEKPADIDAALDLLQQIRGIIEGVLGGPLAIDTIGGDK